MNNEGVKKHRAYIAVGVIFIIAIVAILLLLKETKKTVAPITEPATTTENTTEAVKPEDLVATPFSEPLSEIVYGYEFAKDYKVNIKYNNALFDFNCNNYDEANKKCLEGSGLMRYNNLVIPLFTYNSEDNNYLNYPEDYYIDIKDNYIFLTMNHVGTSSGKTIVYSKEGNIIGEISNIITGYKLNGKKINRLFPSLKDNEYVFYYLDQNTIKIGKVFIDDLSSKIEIERVEGATIN